MDFTFVVYRFVTLPFVSILQGMSLARIEWEVVTMVGRLSLGVAPTRDDLTRVGDIVRTAREGLGFAHVSDLLPPHGAYAPPPSTLPGFAPFQQPPPGTQPGGFSWPS